MTKPRVETSRRYELVAEALRANIASGRLQPGRPVVEYTGGSTGSSLAFVCAVKGYPLRIVSSDALAVEKIRTMEAFGARVELIPSPAGITPDLIPAMVRRAAEIARCSTDEENKVRVQDLDVKLEQGEKSFTMHVRVELAARHINADNCLTMCHLHLPSLPVRALSPCNRSG